ncbi:MAG: 50S ribosomal protein L6 [Caldilineaceae bacterium]
MVISRPTDLRHHKAQHGLTRALLSNMVTGVTEGFTRRLEIHGVGYRAEKRGESLVLQVRKSHPVEFAPPNKTISFEVDKDGRGFTINAIDKCEVGELAAVVPQAVPRTISGQGRYAGEFVRLKAGKSGKK